MTGPLYRKVCFNNARIRGLRHMVRASAFLSRPGRQRLTASLRASPPSTSRRSELDVLVREFAILRWMPRCGWCLHLRRGAARRHSRMGPRGPVVGFPVAVRTRTWYKHSVCPMCHHRRFM